MRRENARVTLLTICYRVTLTHTISFDSRWPFSRRLFILSFASPRKMCHQLITCRLDSPYPPPPSPPSPPSRVSVTALPHSLCCKRAASITKTFIISESSINFCKSSIILYTDEQMNRERKWKECLSMFVRQTLQTISLSHGKCSPSQDDWATIFTLSLLLFLSRNTHSSACSWVMSEVKQSDLVSQWRWWPLDNPRVHWRCCISWWD